MKEKIAEQIESINNGHYQDFAINFDHQDVIDSRDIQERLDELESEYQDLLDTLKDVDEDDKEEAEDNLENWLDEYADEYTSLLAFKEEAEQYTSEWNYGATIINGDYFEDYARQLADDIGAISGCESWPLNHIDWAAASEDLQSDYSEIIFDGESYFVRD